jgi:Ca2+-binding RTX toxin-like protein
MTLLFSRTYHLGDGADIWDSTGYNAQRINYLGMSTQSFSEEIWAGGGNDVIYGFDGYDTIHGEAGNDTLSGGEGDDSLFGDGGEDVLYGDAGNDVLDGGAARDFLSGGADDDTLTGGTGHDTLYGGDDNDQLFGQTGNDDLFGESGADLLVGGSGHDALSGGIGNDTLYAGGGSADIPSASGIDVLDGGAGDDSLFSGLFGDTAAGDRLFGGSGFDRAVVSLANAEAGVVFLRGTFDGDQQLRATNDMWISLDIESLDLTGSNFNDLLLGSNGNDTLAGGAGNDRLSAGLGRDVLTGGTGQDVFMWTRAVETSAARGTRDVVTDFQAGIVTAADGYIGDRLDFSGIDACSGTAANDAFVFIGRYDFFGFSGQLRFTNTADERTVVEGDVDGDRVADFAVELTGLFELRMDQGFGHFIL